MTEERQAKSLSLGLDGKGLRVAEEDHQPRGNAGLNSFTVHRDARLVVRDEEGNVERVNFFGSIIEWNGRYKLFSYNIS